MRYVRIDPSENPGRSDVIVARDADGIAALVRHLWALGHRHYAVVGGPPQHRATAVRQAAFRETLAALGGDLRKVADASGDFGFASGMAAGRVLLRRKPRPTAIIALNDDMAAGVIAAASEAGIAVPRELSVAGFDDSSIAQQVWPPLTTVRQPISRLAEIAVELLTDPVHAGPARVFECDVELVVRQSTGPA